MGLESEKAFPFDAEKDSMGNYDRVYYADDFARYFRSFISSGIFLKEHDNLQVIANDDMSVTIRPGAIIIDGYHYENTEDIIVQLDPADGVLNRIDRISISWIKEERDAHKIVQKGESSYEPIPPECRRNAEYKDYVLADVYVAAGVIKITQDNITDQRLNTDVCGLAIAFSEIDTTLIFSQLQAFYEKVKSENADWAKEKQEAFDKWFENIKNQLESDVAANLQKQIGALANLKTANKSDLVSAINELAEKKIDVLDTMEEVEANTDSGKVAGALALKEVASNLGGLTFYEDDEGNKYVVGADSVPKKLGDIEFYEQRVTTYGGDVWQEYTLENPPKNGIIVFFPYASRMAFYSKDTNLTTDLGANGIDYTFGDATIKLFLSVGLSSYSVVNSVITF